MRWQALIVVLWFLAAVVRSASAETSVIATLDDAQFQAPKEKGTAELVAGKSGKAIKFTFDNDARSLFFTSKIRGQPDWDAADGFSFWLRGDGSANFGGLQFIYDEDYSVRYDYIFPLKNADWHKVTVAWRDLIPVLPGPNARPLDGKEGNLPSKLSTLWVGKWWYWRDYPAHAFAIDDLRLEPKIPAGNEEAAELGLAGPPLARTLAKLQAGQPVTIVTMGDSLTDVRHWANRENPWPTLVEQQLERQFKSAVTIVNPAIGGTQLRQNLVLMPRWLASAPEPDLVTVFFGYNDWDAGMRGSQFEETIQDAIERIRRATHGKADVLVLTTNPSVARWATMAELAEACRAAAAAKNAGLADTEQAFLAAGQANKERLYGFDKTNLGPEGHALVARTVFEAIQKGAGGEGEARAP